MRISIAFVMLFIECAAVSLAAGRVLFVIPPLAFAVVMTIARRRIRISIERYGVVLAAMAVLATLWLVFIPPRLAGDLRILPGAGTGFYVVALLGIWHQAVQIVVVLRHRFREVAGPFPSFPCQGVLVLALSGHFNFWAAHNAEYVAAVGVFVVASAGYYLGHDGSWEFSRYPRFVKAVTLALLAIMTITGGAMAVTIQRNESTINNWLQAITFAPPPESEIGFSREGRLTNITQRRGTEDQNPALYVVSDRVPGYLRGLAFDTYHDSRWWLPNPNRRLHPVEAPQEYAVASVAQRKFFRLSDEAPTRPVQRMDIHTSSALLNTVFLPQSASGLFVDTETVALDRAGAVRETNPERRPGYTVVAPVQQALQPLSIAEIQQYTAVPSTLDPRIVKLAASITAGKGTPREKATAIENYFVLNYKYKIGIQIPRGRDPLNYFLLERPSAHCEYFASGAAMLLRLSGVPARYVTGFVAVERNSTGHFYVARNKDAHAWVEAWDPAQGWFIVEATPPDGVPSARQAGFFSGIRDSFTLAWSRFREGFDPHRFDTAFGMITAVVGAIIASFYGKILLAAMLALIAARLVWRRIRTSRRPPEPAELARLRMLLERADAIAHASGLARAQNETIQHFSTRIAGADSDRQVQELAAWYREYERVRYRDTADAGAHSFLESALPKAP